MIIIQDSREQLPLRFKHPFIEKVKVEKLDVGDYGCQYNDGHIPPFFFERKSIPDLFGTLGKGYNRFKREIIRGQNLSYHLFIIIEGGLEKVSKGTRYSRMDGGQIIRQLFTLRIKHGIESIFCKDSHEVSIYITQFYLAIGRERLRKK